MRLLMIPYDPTNPYQQQLGRGLESSGISVSYSGWSWHLPLLGANAVDVLHIHWLSRATSSPLKFVVALLYFYYQVIRFRRRGGLVIWTVHNLNNHEGRYMRRERFLGRLIGRLAGAVIVHSERAVEPVVAKFLVRRDKVWVIPHPAYTTRVSGVSRAEARARLNLPSEGILLVFVGSVRPYKGVEELIAAYAQAGCSSAHVVIAGESKNSEYRGHIAEIAERTPGVTLCLRRLEEEEIELMLVASNAVVLPYRAILTSGALVMAMGSGRACIAPRMGVFEEHLADGGGILYNPGCVDGLADALREAVEHPEMLEKYGERNRALVSLWSPEAVGAQMADVIRKVCDSRR